MQNELDMLITTRMSNTLKNHYNESSAYAQIKDMCKEAYSISEQIFSSLPPDDMSVVYKFLEHDSVVRTEEETLLYRQGIADCVSILKFLGVV